MNTNTSPQLSIAPLWRRLAAMIYDGLIVMALCMAYWGLAIYCKYGLFGSPLAEGERAQLPLLALLGLFLFIGLFYCYFWQKAGQTVGMRAWRLRAENLQGNNLSWPQAAIRFTCANLSLFLLGTGYWWQLFDKTGTLHDKLSNSRVIELAKEKK